MRSAVRGVGNAFATVLPYILEAWKPWNLLKRALGWHCVIGEYLRPSVLFLPWAISGGSVLCWNSLARAYKRQAGYGTWAPKCVGAPQSIGQVTNQSNNQSCNQTCTTTYESLPTLWA